MQQGIQLKVLMGPVVPVPAPADVIDAIESITITTAAPAASGFQMLLQFSSKSALNRIFLYGGIAAVTPMAPLLRFLLIVTINGSRQPLFDGVVTNIEVQPGSGRTPGTISVTGEDLSRVMDNVDWSGLPYPASSIEARVALICAKYAAFGIIPMPLSTLYPDTPVPTERIPIHKGTDLEYLRELACVSGYVFYLEAGPKPGLSVAYFGPEIKIGVPQPALNVDMDAHTNVEALSFRFDASKGVLPIVYVKPPITRLPAIPVPIPKVHPLQPPLALLPTPITNITRLKETAKMKPGQALSRGIAEASRSQDSVTAQGELDVLRYGRMLKARRLVGVRGAGQAYNGLYYVNSVTSTLRRGEFRQSFELTRNGLVSITPRVPP